MVITVKEIKKNDLFDVSIQHARELFIDYFMDLYQGLSPEQIGISVDTRSYLATIFDRTEQALRDGSVYGFLAYDNKKTIGFTAFGPLEQEQIILQRTLPIHIDYKLLEKDIRIAFRDVVRQKFPQAQDLILMVRKANVHHQQLCLETGFQERDNVIDRSAYLQATYNPAHYVSYVHTFE